MIPGQPPPILTWISVYMISYVNHFQSNMYGRTRKNTTRSCSATRGSTLCCTHTTCRTSWSKGCALHLSPTTSASWQTSWHKKRATTPCPTSPLPTVSIFLFQFNHDMFLFASTNTSKVILAKFWFCNYFAWPCLLPNHRFALRISLVAVHVLKAPSYIKNISFIITPGYWSCDDGIQSDGNRNCILMPKNVNAMLWSVVQTVLANCTDSAAFTFAALPQTNGHGGVWCWQPVCPC